MRFALHTGRRVPIVAVNRWRGSTHNQMRSRRRNCATGGSTSARGLASLRLDGVVVHRLALPDGGVSQHVDTLASQLVAVGGADSLLVANGRQGRHPTTRRRAPRPGSRVSRRRPRCGDADLDACRASRRPSAQSITWSTWDHLPESKRQAIACFVFAIRPSAGTFDVPCCTTTPQGCGATRRPKCSSRSHSDRHARRLFRRVVES